jgi:hypothetical protein
MKLSTLFEARDPELEKNLEPYLKGNFGAYRFRRPKNFVPTIQGMQGKLAQAARYHAREMNGDRWPALEQAFLNRAVTFSGKPSDYLRPRMTLFTYLNNIKTPWPEGEDMAQKFVDSSMAQSKLMGVDNRYMGMSPDMIAFLIKKQLYKSDVVNAFMNLTGYNPNQASPESAFHADDEFGSSSRIQYAPKTLEMMKKYIDMATNAQARPPQ